MSIDITALNLPQARLERRETAPRTYDKLDSAKARAAVAEMKESAEPRDLLELSGKAADALEAYSARADKTVGRACNYSLDVFFSRDMPSQANDDGSYTVRGASFSADELADARSALRAAAGSMSVGPGRNLNLDYRNYAEMAVAENSVRAYAASRFNDEQRGVVESAMREYNAGLAEAQDSYLKGLERRETSGALSEYYGATRVLTQDMADALNSFKAQVSQVTGRAFRPSVAGEDGGYEQVATNKDLISRIGSLFSDGNLSDGAVFQSKMDAYASLAREAYLAQGLRPQDLSAAFARDRSALENVMRSVLSASRRSVDISL